MNIFLGENQAHISYLQDGPQPLINGMNAPKINGFLWGLQPYLQGTHNPIYTPQESSRGTQNDLRFASDDFPDFELGDAFGSNRSFSGGVTFDMMFKKPGKLKRCSGISQSGRE